MDLKPLSAEEIEAIQNTIPWVKVLGSGWALSFIVALWKIFGIYKRLEIAENDLKILKDSNLLTLTRHEELQDSCQLAVRAQINEAINTLHFQLIDEMKEVRNDVAEIKETTCHTLGELKQLTLSLKQ